MHLTMLRQSWLRARRSALQDDLGFISPSNKDRAAARDTSAARGHAYAEDLKQNETFWKTAVALIRGPTIRRHGIGLEAGRRACAVHRPATYAVNYLQAPQPTLVR